MKSLPLTLTDTVVKPARLCLIERRDGVTIRIAEAQSAITVDAETYLPTAGVEISAVKHTLGGDAPSMEIRAAHSVEGTFDTAEIIQGLFDGAAVNLYIVNRSDPTALGLMFTGTIQPVSYDIAGMVSFDVHGLQVGAQAGYLQKYSPMCRTDLFSTLCGLNAASYAQACTVGAIIDNFNFTVAGLGSPPADGWFNGGVCHPTSGIAFEMAHWNQAGLQITAFLPCSGAITAGQALTLYPGCDKRIETCQSKFNNTANFQGEPHSLGVFAATAGG